MVSGRQYQAILDMLDRPEQDNQGLADLFSRPPVWDANEAGGATAVGGPELFDCGRLALLD